jgi:hypothetical protein
MPMGGAELQTLMPMTPNQRRSIAYPAALAVVAGLGWAATYRTEADFLTLLSSASIHAELAASIPADADSADGRALRSKLLGDAHDFLERAERVEPGTSGGRQIRAFLAMIEGDAARAAELYAEARSLPDCTPDQLGRLVMHEAKALSNAGRVEVALQLLDAHGAQRRPEDAVPWSAHRARLLFRAGSQPGSLRRPGRRGMFDRRCPARGHGRLRRRGGRVPQVRARQRDAGLCDRPPQAEGRRNR